MKTTAHSTFKVGDNDEFLYENLFTKKKSSILENAVQSIFYETKLIRENTVM